MTKRIGVSLFFIYLSLLAEVKEDWCGTISALNLFKEGKGLRRPVLPREEFIERLNFRVHFTRTGPNACDSAYAIAVADWTEYSWHKQFDTLNWAPPPPDYGRGGDDRYDVYIYDLPAGVAGWCVMEAWYSHPYPDGATTFIGIDNQLGRSDFLKIVCAHELSHASQLRYSAQEMFFIYENTATWMEDLCYEEINSYVRYFATSPNPLGSPHYPIISTHNLYHYAGGIWFMFLEEYYDQNCPRRVWEIMGEVSGQNTLAGIDATLRRHYSSSLREALKYYGLWRYFVGPRADTVNYFREGNLWPAPYLLRSHYEYPGYGTEDPCAPFAPGGTNFIQFRNGGGKLSINFNGADWYKWRCWVVGYRPPNPRVFEMRLDSASAAGSDSFHWQEEDHFALVPIVCDWEYLPGALTFYYSIDCRILKDVGLQSIAGIPISGDTGEILTPFAWIKNYGMTNERFLALFRVGEFYSDTQEVSLNSGDSILCEFSPCTLFRRGYNNYTCTLALNGDERIGNNSKTGRVLIFVRDVGVRSILEPAGTVRQGDLIRPKVRIKNFGNLPVRFDVKFWIGNWSTTKGLYLPASREHDLSFDSAWLAADTGEFATKCSIIYADDKNPLNNKVEGRFFVRGIGIEEEREAVISQYPERVEIYNALGTRVLTREAPFSLGLLKLPSGIYFARLYFGKERIEKKILIIR